MRFLIFACVAAFAIGYVPASFATPSEGKSEPATASSAGKKASTSASKLVDINHATKAQLLKLPGIGASEADKIIGGRPYTSKSQLITKDILSYPTFDGIKKRIIAG
jgi:DNA uptake protein ComE-like DNA-binding protein